jgi:hypothetical protein
MVVGLGRDFELSFLSESALRFWRLGVMHQDFRARISVLEGAEWPLALVDTVQAVGATIGANRCAVTPCSDQQKLFTPQSCQLTGFLQQPELLDR